MLNIITQEMQNTKDTISSLTGKYKEVHAHVLKNKLESLTGLESTTYHPQIRNEINVLRIGYFIVKAELALITITARENEQEKIANLQCSDLDTFKSNVVKIRQETDMEIQNKSKDLYDLSLEFEKRTFDRFNALLNIGAPLTI